jgi:hypothetical protein
MMKRALPIFFLVFLINLPASVNAADWHQNFPKLKMIGTGEFRWWGFHIYTARLWQESSTFNENALFALELTYQKSISRDRFVEASIDEIKRIHQEQISAEQIEKWRHYMEQAFVDVKAGDQHIGVYLPEFGARFYNKERLLTEIKDPQFAHFFFSIWLDPKSKDQQLRKNLTGLKSGGQP